jgi:hypothetical protein
MNYRAPKGAISRWAEKYGYSERAVKKFVDVGRRVEELPPFDEPEKMEAWAEKNLHQVTRRFREGVEKAMGGSSGKKPEDKKEIVLIQIPDVSDAELGLETQLLTYQREFAMLAKLRAEALAKGEFHRASNYFDQQQKVSAEIRQLEKALPIVLEQRGEYQKTADVRECVSDFLNVLKRSLLGRDLKISDRLATAATDTERRDIWKSEIHAAFRESCESGFGETLSLE